MKFSGRRPTPNPWRPLVLLVTVLSISTILILWKGEGRDDEQPSPEPPRVAVRVKKPIQAETPPSLAGKAKEERKAPKPKTAEPAAKAAGPKVSTNRYKVQKGESLHAVSGRKEVYGDPLKWPSLFRLNREKLGEIEETPDLPEKALPQGLELRFVTAEEAAANAAKLGEEAWVVNVISTHEEERIVLPAIFLMKKGLPVYIGRAQVKGKAWVRLRVGFFKDRPSAEPVANEVRTLLNIKDAWVTKAEKAEIERFGGY